MSPEKLLALALDPSLILQARGLPPDPWQRELLLSAERQVLLNCSRQSGKSTFVSALALHTALFKPKALVLLLSPSQRQSGEIFRKVTEAYNAVGRPVRALDAEGKPHLADFGLAKRVAAESMATYQGQVLGTPAYMSPEQARGDKDAVDPRSDVYSLGVVLYELLTGEAPFRGELHMVLRQVLEEEPTPPRRLIGSLPRDLENICFRAMRKEVGQRYPTAAALAEDLRRFLDGGPVQARPVSPAARGWRWCRRRPLVAALLAALSFSLVAGSATCLILWRQTELERQDLQVQRDRAQEQRQRAELESRALQSQRDSSELELERAQLWRRPLASELCTLGEQQTSAPRWVRRKLLRSSLDHAWQGLESVRRAVLNEWRRQSLVVAYQREIARAQIQLLTLRYDHIGEATPPAYQVQPQLPDHRRHRGEEATFWNEVLAHLPDAPKHPIDLEFKCLLVAAEFDLTVTDAIRHLEQARDIAEALEREQQDTSPYLARAYLRLAEAQRWAGRFDEAVATLHRGLAWPGRDPALAFAGVFRDEQQRIECLLSLAELRVEMNQPHQARPWVQQAETLLSSDPPSPPSVNPQFQRMAKALATVLDQGDYAKVYADLPFFCANLDYHVVRVGASADRKGQWERSHARLGELQCLLGQLARLGK
jgi:hypothetical protein